MATDTGTTTSAQPSSGFWAAVPRGVRLDERGFVTRHRIISGVLLLHPPLLAAIAVWRGVGDLFLWGYLGGIVLGFVLGVTLRCQVGRASAVSFGLMCAAAGLLHVGGGLTDLHIWFYALLALVALYQQWTPFLLAVGFVAVHHLTMSAWMPEMIFSSPLSLRYPFVFALLHAVFLLGEAIFLAYGWKFTEAADRARRAEQARAEQQAAAQAQAQARAGRGARPGGRGGGRGPGPARGSARPCSSSSWPGSSRRAAGSTRTWAPRPT